MKNLLKQLYNSEINVSLSSFWDAGFTVKIGDEMNGFKAEITSTDLDEIEEWIKLKAVELYPKSKFAKENTWIISIHGYGDFEFIGNEYEAEEMRKHKSRWEGANGAKELKYN